MKESMNKKINKQNVVLLKTKQEIMEEVNKRTE